MSQEPQDKPRVSSAEGSRFRRALRWCGRAVWWWLRAGMVLLLLGLLGALGAGWWVKQNILVDLPQDLSSLRTWRPPTSARVYGSDGALIDEFYLERRIWVPLSELSTVTQRAFIAAEDRRFYRHHGVDYQGIARALWTNLQAGGVAQGGSTITQQLVKNILVGNERSYERKLKEAALALRLERELSKDELLELFVNYIYLGAGNYGVEAAAQDYFGIPARDLDPGQAALLAGLIPSPSRYSPRRSPERAAERRAIVLRAMVEEGYVTAEAAEAYQREPVTLRGRTEAPRGTDASYITEVRRELRRLLPDSVVYEAGLQVYTAFDPAVQAAAEQAVRGALVALDERQGLRATSRNLSAGARDRFLVEAPGLPRSLSSGAVLRPPGGHCFEAVVGAAGGDRGPADLGTLLAGPFRFSLREADRALKVRGAGPEPTVAPLSAVALAGDVLRVCVEEGERLRLDTRPWGEGAAVVLENETGRVVALVGGYEVGLEGFVRATQSRRQPGSSFKPYVYGAALLGGHTQIDTVLDAPLSLPAGNGAVWSPQNYDGSYDGPLPMRSALAKSLNTVAVRLGLEVGSEAVGRLARQMGVRSPLRRDPTIALGSSEVTPMDQALGYATIARMGVPTDPVFIDLLRDSAGVELGRAGGPILIDGARRGRLPGGPLPRALPAGVAYELADMLREVVRKGTARRAWDPLHDRAGKTGTTNDNIDAWFVGFTPKHTVAVWIGSDSQASLGDKETGGKSALPAWLEIVAVLGEEAGARFPIPDEAVLLPWGDQWVGLPRGSVPRSLLSVGAAPEAGPLGDFPPLHQRSPPRRRRSSAK